MARTGPVAVGAGGTGEQTGATGGQIAGTAGGTAGQTAGTGVAGAASDTARRALGVPDVAPVPGFGGLTAFAAPEVAEGQLTIAARGGSAAVLAIVPAGAGTLDMTATLGAPAKAARIARRKRSGWATSESSLRPVKRRCSS